MRNTSLEVLEGRIGYHFKDIYLLECALTHTSFANEQKIHRYKDYERLEFLGDAVLEMVSSAFLYNEYPDKREGELTKIRASLSGPAGAAAPWQGRRGQRRQRERIHSLRRRRGRDRRHVPGQR